MRAGDLLFRERFAAKLGEVLDYHNFVLANYYRVERVDFQRTLDEQMAYAEGYRAPDRRTSPKPFTSFTGGARAYSTKAPRAPCSTSTTAPIRS